MKKVIVAMVVMFLVIVPLGGVWSILFSPIIGGNIDQSFICPIYVGLIILAGLVVGAAVVVHDEIKKLREEIKDEAERLKQGDK